MGIIALEFENTLKHTEIVMPLVSSSINEAGDSYNNTGMTDKAQTAVFGIQTPLIMINNTIIDFDCIKYFSLKSVGRLPELQLTVEDRYQLINTIDKVGQDNEVCVQILPRFDNTYKKISLSFYISSIRIIGTIITLTAIYKLPAIMSSEFKSYGSISTYDLFKKIATDNGLGFASNIIESADSRYIYCNNMSLLSLMNDEIQYSAAPDTILDWWIDLWNNINLADIKDRYEAVDSDEDLQVWISGQVNEITVDAEITPVMVKAVLNDHPIFNNSELHVKKYITKVNPGGQISNGSDKLYSIYHETKNENLDYLIQDGDIKNDVFTNYEYVGENMGDYNYLLSKCLRTGYMQKINSETVDVTLQSPLLGLMRGHKVNFMHYINDDKVENKIKALELNNEVDRNVDSNISLSEYDISTDAENTGDGQFILDRTVSGQYLITGVNITYSDFKWDYILTLAKPASTKANILKEHE